MVNKKKKNEMYGRIQLKIESISNFQITWNNQFDTWFVICYGIWMVGQQQKHQQQ